MKPHIRNGKVVLLGGRVALVPCPEDCCWGCGDGLTYKGPKPWDVVAPTPGMPSWWKDNNGDRRAPNNLLQTRNNTSSRAPVCVSNANGSPSCGTVTGGFTTNFVAAKLFPGNNVVATIRVRMYAKTQYGFPYESRSGLLDMEYSVSYTADGVSIGQTLRRLPPQFEPGGSVRYTQSGSPVVLTPAQYAQQQAGIQSLPFSPPSSVVSVDFPGPGNDSVGQYVGWFGNLAGNSLIGNFPGVQCGFDANNFPITVSQEVAGCVGPYAHVIPSVTWVRTNEIVSGTTTRTWKDEHAKLRCPSSQFAISRKSGEYIAESPRFPAQNERYRIDREFFYATRVELLDSRYQDVFRFAGSFGGNLP